MHVTWPRKGLGLRGSTASLCGTGECMGTLHIVGELCLSQEIFLFILVNYFCLCLHVYACAYLWFLEIDIKCPPQSLPTVVFETGILTELGAHQFGKAG